MLDFGVPMTFREYTKRTLMVLGGVLFILALQSARCKADLAPSVYDLPLRFVDDHATSVEFSQWRGHYVIATMVYLTCKTSCPLTMQKLKTIEHDLAAVDKKAEFILTSFNSDTDTAASLAAFKRAHALSEQWHFLTGSKEVTRSLSFLLGFSYQRIDGTTEFNHSNRILLLGPDGTVLTALDRLNQPHDALIAAVPAPPVAVRTLQPAE